jgi:Protein of unknown function (DUF1553)/Protein of unknown function (DUF1549)/Concanavalin A-like lectin/glucanases superfamily/Planctomycete cytochrome C
MRVVAMKGHGKVWMGAAVAACAVLGSASARAGDKLEFNRDVRPIFAENCFACHGTDSTARKGDLRLDRRADALKAKAFIPGNPDDSELVERIFSDMKSRVMPSPKSGKKLTAAQKETLKRWIAEGAEYQPQWSLIAPKRPPLPAVKNIAWVRNPIDQFILSGLEKQGLAPAPEADKRTLARRVSLDLTGLPPSPEDVETFVNDAAPNAYEKYVDKLLAMPQYGEHRARYWLDLARYADTHGIHFDNYREIWTYRDWVIKAFNDNKPFDQFTVEQLAGDLLPNPTFDQLVATGFNRCNITSNEGGLIPEEYLVLYTRDRTETASRVWLGLTANCAVCHDHKFDPISQKEFYEMSAFFNNTTQGAMDGNIKDTPPVILVPAPADRPRWEAATKELAEVRKQADARKTAARADFDKWLASATAERMASYIPSEGLKMYAPLSEGEGKAFNVTVDGKPRSISLASGFAWDAGHVAAKAFKSEPGAAVELADVGDFEKDKGFSYGAWVKFTKGGENGAVMARMEDKPGFRGWDLWIQGGRVAAHIINKWPEDALKVVSKNPIKETEWNHLFITYDGSGKQAGVKIYVNGVPQETTFEADQLKSTIRTTVPLTLAQRHTTSRLDNMLLQDVRVYGRTLSPLEVEEVSRGTLAAWLASKPADKRSDVEKNELFDWWLPTLDPAYQALSKKRSELEQEEAAIKARGSIAYIMKERTEAPVAYILNRGEYDKRKEQVKPATPEALPPLPADAPRNRLGFARWLVRPENPLTARVAVNRYWQEIFGQGIVRTPEDFGVTGDEPSNPELLDWMAVDFRESGWDIKRFFKMIVTSATYRQAATDVPEKLEKDPSNRLLSRGPRFRMDAEMIRDYALASSGLLVRKIGGPSVRPYQPPGVWEAVAMIGSDTRDYKADSGDKLYRRSMYTFWKRAAPPASMDILNAPTREVCTVRRDRTDTPLQALVTLNDPQFIEAARFLAQTTLQHGGDKPDVGVDFMARRVLCRPLKAEETKVVEAELGELIAYYKAHPEEAKKLIAIGESKADPALDSAALAAWTMTANELLNLDEVLNK